MKLKDNKIAPLTNNDRVVEIPEISNASAKNQTSALVLEFIGWAGSVLVLIPYIVVCVVCIVCDCAVWHFKHGSNLSQQSEHGVKVFDNCGIDGAVQSVD